MADAGSNREVCVGIVHGRRIEILSFPHVGVLSVFVIVNQYLKTFDLSIYRWACFLTVIDLLLITRGVSIASCDHKRPRGSQLGTLCKVVW